MAWARWAVALLAAVAGAVTVWAAPVDQLERVVWTLGLRHVVPQLAPPLGETARLGLTALAALLGALAGWLLLALLGVGRTAPAAAPATAPERAHDDGRQPSIPAWRLPPRGLPPSTPAGARAGSAMAGQAMPAVPAVAADRADGAAPPPAEAAMAAQPAASTPEAPGTASPAAAMAAPEPSPSARTAQPARQGMAARR